MGPTSTLFPVPTVTVGLAVKIQMHRLIHHLVIMGTLLSLFTTPLLAKKTDVVVLMNGDRITGEINKLERGRLEYKTDDMGWIFIDWTKVVNLSSKSTFDVEIKDGARFIGSLQESAEPGKLSVSTEKDTVSLDMLYVVKITPLESLFRERFKGYVDVGFNFEKANQLTNLILGTEVTYRTLKWETTLTGSSYIKNEKSVEAISRHSLQLNFSRLMKKRWQTTLLSMAQHNSELGVRLRAIIGGGLGRRIVQTNQILLILSGGVVGTLEQFMGSEDYQYNAELLAGADFQAFRYAHPRLDTSLKLVVFPSITDFGRFRIEFDGRVRYEVLKDFYISLRVFDHFDGRPGGKEEEVSNNDYGVEASLTYSFR